MCKYSVLCTCTYHMSHVAVVFAIKNKIFIRMISYKLMALFMIFFSFIYAFAFAINASSTWTLILAITIDR